MNGDKDPDGRIEICGLLKGLTRYKGELSEVFVTPGTLKQVAAKIGMASKDDIEKLAEKHTVNRGDMQWLIDYDSFIKALKELT